jgi:hypothetical protein
MLTTTLTPEGFALAMARLSANYGREISSFQQQLYRDHLRELTDDQLLRAVEQQIAASKYMPSVAELKELACGHQVAAGAAESAFAAVQQCMALAGGIVANTRLDSLPLAVRKAAARTGMDTIRNMGIGREMTSPDVVLATFSEHYALALLEPEGVIPQLPPPPPELPREIPQRIAAMSAWAAAEDAP